MILIGCTLITNVITSLVGEIESLNQVRVTYEYTDKKEYDRHLAVLQLDGYKMYSEESDGNRYSVVYYRPVRNDGVI